ncbi:MAG: fatty acid desaturase family protein [Chitinophagales bacterium]
MTELKTLTDPTYAPPQENFLNRFFYRLLNDKRDFPFVILTFKITLIMLPLGIALYLPFVKGISWWSIAAAYFIFNNFIFKGPFGLMLHCTSHRKFFKANYEALNHYLPWVVGPFFGQTPETYYSHHVWMHHLENNLEDDRSSTMKYQRDNFGDFLIYFFDFLFFGMFRLMNYFSSKKRNNLIVNCLTGELLFIALCVGLSFINFSATLVVFILPFIISRFIMMLGNWTQHAFVAPEDPGNAYKNSITCVNAKYNHKCWNDGYHISHHIRMGMHWTQHPEFFQEHLSEYAANKAIVFNGIGYITVFWLLMLKKYGALAKHALNLNRAFSGDEEFIQTMKHRLAPIRS